MGIVALRVISSKGITVVATAFRPISYRGENFTLLGTINSCENEVEEKRNVLRESMNKK